MWPILRHNCPHCHHYSAVKYTPSIFSQVYFCDECHQSSTNSVHIVSSAEDRLEKQEDRDLASLFSSNLTLAEVPRQMVMMQHQQADAQAQPIPIPSIVTTTATNTNSSSGTHAFGSSSSSPSSTTSSLAHPPPRTERKAVEFQQYQYYPSMHYTPTYSAYPSTQSSELMLRRRREDEMARLENMAMERRGFGVTSTPTAEMLGADGMDVDM